MCKYMRIIDPIAKAYVLKFGLKCSHKYILYLMQLYMDTCVNTIGHNLISTVTYNKICQNYGIKTINNVFLISKSPP